MKDKIKHLTDDTRVMTIAVSSDDIPWSAPVYFVFHNNAFYFFSNKNSRHIEYARDKKQISASIFQDSDNMNQILGFQMLGNIKTISNPGLYLTIVKKYVSKFNFLKKIFGTQIIDNKKFFLEKFKSHLYCFYAKKIFLSDNSNKSDKRSQIDLNENS